MKKIFLTPPSFFLACAVQAATITVDSTDDSLAAITGTCTLRGAVNAINRGDDANSCTGTGGYGSSDTIRFDSTVFGSATTIPVAANDEHIEITKNLTINGPVDASGNPLLTLDANPGDGSGSNRILYVTGGTGLTITAVRFVNGNAGSSQSDRGGAIRVTATNHTLTLEQCVFEDNQAANYGGSVFTWDIVSIRNSSFSGNRINIDNGSGGAVWADTATIRNSVFSGNSATRGSSGAVYAATAIVSDSTFSSNQANYGGAMAAATAAIINSTFSDNSANYSGGAVRATISAAISNSTFSKNSAANQGGAVYANVELNARHLTLLSNQAGSSGQALYIYSSSGRATLYNSIVIGKNGYDQCGKESGASFTGSHNLEGWIDTGGNWQDGATTCGTSIDAMPDTGDALSGIIDSTLKDNGGPTQTLALLSDSPAIGAADRAPDGTSQMLDISAVPAQWIDATFDQRGFGRLPVTSGRSIGAYEHDGLGITTTTLANGTSQQRYSQSLNANCNTDLQWSQTGLPTGLDINSESGEILGTPQADGNHAVTITVSDTAGRQISRIYNLLIQPRALPSGGTPIPALPAPLLLMLAALLASIAVRQRGR